MSVDPQTRPFQRRHCVGAGVALLIFSWAVWFSWPGGEIYMTCQEVEAFFAERLELDNGEFRYWMYSDVGISSTKYPLTGSYAVAGNRLTLHHPHFQGEASIRYLDRVNGIPVAWRSDGWEQWSEKRKIHPYGVMVRTPKPLLPFREQRRPSLESLGRP